MLHSCFVFPFLCSLRASSARCRNFPVFTSDSIISSQLFDSYSSYHVLNSLRSFTLSFLICSSISLRFADISLRQLIHIYICDYTTHFMHRKQHILLIFTQYGRIACAPISAITPASVAGKSGAVFAVAQNVTLFSVHCKLLLCFRSFAMMCISIVIIHTCSNENKHCN